MTKQEHIEEMANYIAKCCPDKVDDGCFDKNMNCVSCIATELYNAGYRKIDEFEKCRKCPAWSGTDCTRNPYTKGCLDDKVNLKNEIKRLEKENKQLKTECALLDNELRVARQDTINVLNELKERIPLAMSKQYVCAQIDKMIEELAK